MGELKQLFNAIDPSPFRDKDLDSKAEEFIVGWAKKLPGDATLALVVDLDREAGLPDELLFFRDGTPEGFLQQKPSEHILSNGRHGIIVFIVRKRAGPGDGSN